MALKWINDYCKNAKFILKTDDDIIVNTFALIKNLKLLKINTSYSKLRV